MSSGEMCSTGGRSGPRSWNGARASPPPAGDVPARGPSVSISFNTVPPRDAAGQLQRPVWMVTPISVSPLRVEDRVMVQLAIRCHPSVPTSNELERWLERQVHDLRADAPGGTVRLSRLTQGLPSADCQIGWLVELELSEGEPLLAGDRLADALTDMRLLGLQPTLLAPTSHGQSPQASPPRAATTTAVAADPAPQPGGSPYGDRDTTRER